MDEAASASLRGRRNWLIAGNLPLLIFTPEETAVGRGLPFFGGGGLGGNGVFLDLVSAAGLGLFLRGFLLVRLRGFIAHDFSYSLRN